MKRKQIGNVMVDSGQLFVIDPAQLDTWHHGDYTPDSAPDNSYARVVEAMFNGGGYGETEHGVVVSAEGDGVYPVSVTEDEDGRIIKLEVVFAEAEV